MKLESFSIKPLNRVDDYYGFELDGERLYRDCYGRIFHNSGKSVAEQGIVGHVSRFPDNFMLVGVKQSAHFY